MGFRQVLGRFALNPAPRSEPVTLTRSTAAANFSVDIPPEMQEAMTAGGALAPRISRNEALQVPAVLRGRNLICSTLAGLPLKIHGPDRREVDGYLLGGNIDPDIPNVVTLASTLEDLLFEGVGWWRVLQWGWDGYPVHAQWVPTGSVHVSGTGDLPSTAKITADIPFPTGGQVYIDGVPVGDHEVIRFDSPNPPLLRHAARAIRTALRLDRTSARFADEPMPQGIFTELEGTDGLSDAPGSANDGTERSEIEAFLDDWAEARRNRSWAYAGGVKPEILQWSPKDLQLADARQHAVLEIARAMGIDPEDLGVSTTSRTYQNSEQRRLDLLDFTLAAYVQALQQRLSMRDILPRGYVARMKFDGFLRSDTKTRMETYRIGRDVGAYTTEEIRELEDRPPLDQQDTALSAEALALMIQKVYLGVGVVITAEEARALLNRAGAGLSTDTPELPGRPTTTRPGQLEADVPAAKFDTDADATVTFDAPELAESFRVNVEKRTISGLIVPWGKVAANGQGKWRFTDGSLYWSDPGRVKLNTNHDHTQAIAKAVRLQPVQAGLDASFQVARGPEGDRALSLAEDGVLDGFSVEIHFEDGDGWTPDPADKSVRLVNRAKLRGVALTAMPAFDDARVSAVAASLDNPKEKTMTTDAVDTKAGEQFDFAGYAEKLGEQIVESHKNLTTELGASIGESVSAGVKAALEALPAPQDGPQPVRAARYSVTREAPVYSFNGLGHSLVRDAWYAARERDDESIERLRKYRKQNEEMSKLAAQFMASQAFAPQSTSTASEVIPPGYRPDLYVPELMQGRPLVGLCSRGTIGNATPFLVPTFTSSSGVAGDHTEGTNPSDGSLSFDEETVTPGALSGRLTLTREIVDSSNPAIDQIALATMRESYNQQTEQKVYAALNGTAAVGNRVEYAAASVITDVRGLLADYPFVRFAAPTGAAINQKVTRQFATAVGTDGRPLLPSVGAQNTAGLGNAVNQGWFIDGLTFVPAWSITDSATNDVALIVNRADVWVWESPLLTFRFEEKQGPANIELNIFGYFATHVLRPAGVFAVRNPA